MVCHEANLHGFPYECWTGMYWTSLGCHRTLWELAPPGRRSAFSWWRVKGGFLSEFEIKINTKFTRKSNEKIYSLMMRMRNPWVCSHCCMTLNYILANYWLWKTRDSYYLGPSWYWQESCIFILTSVIRLIKNLIQD